MKKQSIFIGVFAILATAAVLHANFYEGSFLVAIEAPLELINMVLSLIALGFAIAVIKLFSTGSQAGAWRWMAVSAIFFALVEILGVLKGFEIWKESGLIDFVEFFFVISLMVGFCKQFKVLNKIKKG